MTTTTASGRPAPPGAKAWIYRAALGVGLLLVSLLAWRATVAFRARAVLALRVAESKTVQAAIRARFARRVLPAFDGLAHVQGDCVAAQRMAMALAPRADGDVFRKAWAWTPLSSEQLDASARHREDASRLGDPATKCDRVAPASGRRDSSSAWPDPFDVFTRTQMLIVDGRVRAHEGDAETAGLRFLQSRRLGFELGLDENLTAIGLGAVSLAGADHALARLIADGAPDTLRARASRELAALEPFLPDLPEAFRLRRAENASQLGGTLLDLPFLTDGLWPATQLNCGACSSGQYLAALVRPISSHGVDSLDRTQRETDAALRALSSLELKALEKLRPLAEHVQAPNLGSPNMADVALTVGRERLRAAAESAILHAVIVLERERDALGRYPGEPKLPMDPFAPTQPLGYHLYPDGHYVISSVGDGSPLHDRWKIASRQ